MTMRVLAAEGAPDLVFVICGYDDGTVEVRDLNSGLSADVALHFGRHQAGHIKGARCVFSYGASNMFLTAGDDGKLNAFRLSPVSDAAPS